MRTCRSIAAALALSSLALIPGCGRKMNSVLGPSSSTTAGAQPGAVLARGGGRGHGRFGRDLLIVIDTRCNVDMAYPGHPDSLVPPHGQWPTQAELDTFLCARGGVPWQRYPEGTVSSPGVFAGYQFDTLGTWTSGSDPTVPLDLLMQYRHVIWLTDLRGAIMTGYPAPMATLTRMTALRWMSQIGYVNTLDEYVSAGGQAWIAGGGAGYASSAVRGAWQPDFASVLLPGALMYDAPHWRSGFQDAAVIGTVVRTSDARRLPGLPSELDMKNPGTDPLPPLRKASDFYPVLTALESLSKPNSILENVGEGDDDGGRTRSALDTLYAFTGAASGGAALPGTNPCMTFYHGHDNGGVIFSGFDLWSFQRAQCEQLVDGVLEGIWHLHRQGGVAHGGIDDDGDVRRHGAGVAQR